MVKNVSYLERCLYGDGTILKHDTWVIHLSNPVTFTYACIIELSEIDHECIQMTKDFFQYFSK